LSFKPNRDIHLEDCRRSQMSCRDSNPSYGIDSISNPFPCFSRFCHHLYDPNCPGCWSCPDFVRSLLAVAFGAVLLVVTHLMHIEVLDLVLSLCM